MANISTSKTRARFASEFFRPHDKGSARPAFCFPSAIQTMREDYNKIEKLLNSRLFNAANEPELKARRNQLKNRLRDIDKQLVEVRKEVSGENADYWNGRRKELGEKIREISPSKTDRAKKRVSPHEVLKREKGGKGIIKISDEHGGDALTLSEAKKEFMIISRAMDEESGIGALEKE